MTGQRRLLVGVTLVEIGIQVGKKGDEVIAQRSLISNLARDRDIAVWARALPRRMNGHVRGN